MSEVNRKLEHRVFEDLAISHVRRVLEQGGYFVESLAPSDLEGLAPEELEVVSLLVARAKSPGRTSAPQKARDLHPQLLHPLRMTRLAPPKQIRCRPSQSGKIRCLRQ